MTYDSDSGRLTFLKETACSPEWLHASTSTVDWAYWIVFMQVLEQYKQSAFAFFQWKFLWKKN